ncbi:MAG: SDR family NAD(P)-dependent oxidoreductase, partial [Bacteroidota bacterium]
MNNGVAVVGMAGRFPMAKNIGEFYLNLREGGNGVKPVSKQRRLDSTLPGKNYLPFGLLDDIDKFDFEFFGISQAEAELMDPNQRLMLEVVYEAIENAGYNFEDLSGSNTNVYYSCPEFVYHKLIEKGNAMAVTGNISALTAGRIARYFNLLGNALQIDTTCSSSLVSVHMACQELLRHQADYALVCGSNVVLFPPVLQDDLDIGIIAPDGKAKAFDSRADGSSGGEGFACVLLKRVEDAQRDRDTIHAVIKGSAVNQDANRSSFLTAPSKIAQSEVITFAWKNSAVHPETIAYVEAHGTGTKLGDPIEIDGLNLAFQAQTAQKHFCAVSSVKTNIGHTDRVAGLAGLIKTVLSLKHQELFPSLHFEEPNPHIDFENSAVYVNTKLKKWESSPLHPRRAGVSGFGLSGTNCHVILEEAIPAERAVETTEKTAEPLLFCVSAKSKESLQGNIRALYQYLGEPNALHPIDISFTLNQGRKHFPYRYAFAATDLAEIRQQLADGLAEGFTEERSFAYCPEKASELILLFSVDTVLADSQVEAWAGNYPAFAKAYRQCLEIADKAHVDGHDVQAFIHQYCFFKVLEDRGIGSENLLGIGLGEVLVEVLLEEITLEEGLQQASQYQESKPENLASRLRNYVNRDSARKKLLFAEMGEGILSRTLQEIHTAKDNYSISCLAFDQAEPVLALIQALYLEGFVHDWKKIYRNQPVQRISLPTYHFKKSRAWAKEQIDENKVNEWMYDITWAPQAVIPASQPIKGQVLLLVMDKYGLGEELVKQLEKDNTLIKLHLGYEYQQMGEREYRVGVDSEDDYKKLEKTLIQTGFIITGILGLNFYGGFPTHDTAGSIGVILKSGIYAQFHLLKAFSHYLSAKHFYVAFVTSHAHQVVEKEEVIPTRSLASVFLKALLVEYPLLKVGSIDVAFKTSQQELLAEDILLEIGLEDRLRFVAYRDRVRFVPSIHQLKASTDWLDKQASFIQPNGVYLITGGASGIGFETAQLIAAQESTQLIILGRSALPPKASWNELPAGLSEDTISRVHNLQSLEKLGATVEYYATDVASESEMEAVFKQIKQQHNRLTGIIHSAGVPGKWQPFSHVSFDDFKETLSAKMVGTVNLDQASQSLKPEFFLAYSSLNSVVPQKHTLAYAVANAFEDAFVLSKFNSPQRYLAIGWPGWYETGMSVAHGKVPMVDKNSPLKPLSTEDGLKALEYSYKINKPAIQVADIDLQAFAINPYFLIGQVTSTGNFVPAVKEAVEVTPELDDLDNDFTETEAKLAAIWRDVLKVKTIRLEDDFFDLGGHSLNGTQVMNRIEK